MRTGRGQFLECGTRQGFQERQQGIDLVLGEIQRANTAAQEVVHRISLIGHPTVVVVLHYLTQRREATVMHVGSGGRDVAQSRGLEGSQIVEAPAHREAPQLACTGIAEHLKMSANNTDLTKRSDAGFVLENARAGFSWAFRTDEDNGGFSASKQFTGARELELINTTAVAANVELHLSNGGKNIGGQWLNASSRSYKENINELSSEDAMQALKGLKSVTYQLKRDVNKAQRVGFIAEDVPALLATKDKKTVDSLQIIAVLTKAYRSRISLC